MFERLRKLIKAMGQLIRDPYLLEDYQSSLDTLRHYEEEAVRDKKIFQDAYGQAKAELDFRKDMEAQGIVVGQEYVDKQLAPELLPDHSWGAQSRSAGSALKITGFHLDGEIRYIETDLGNVKANIIVDRKELGLLLPKGQAGERADQADSPGYADLLSRMKEAGFAPVETPGSSDDYIMWEDVKTGKEFGLDGWEQVHDFVTDIEQGKIAGMLFYPSGEMQSYNDPDQFIKDYDEEMDSRGPSGVSARTITRDPAVRKTMDDLIYGEFGEENPHHLDFYAQQQDAQQVEAPELEVVEMEM